MDSPWPPILICPFLGLWRGVGVGEKLNSICSSHVFNYNIYVGQNPHYLRRFSVPRLLRCPAGTDCGFQVISCFRRHLGLTDTVGLDLMLASFVNFSPLSPASLSLGSLSLIWLASLSRLSISLLSPSSLRFAPFSEEGNNEESMVCLAKKSGRIPVSSGRWSLAILFPFLLK